MELNGPGIGFRGRSRSFCVASITLGGGRAPGAMPYRWEKAEGGAIVLRLWPFRSLTPQGHVWFIAITAGLLALPLLAALGSPVMWGLLPFVVIAIWGMMAALRRSNRRGDIREVLVLTRTSAQLTRSDPGRDSRRWQANPYWIRVTLRGDGPVEDYLTLSGARQDGGAVELGAFLSPDERISLAAELREVLAGLNAATGNRPEPPPHGGSG